MHPRDRQCASRLLCLHAPLGAALASPTVGETLQTRGLLLDGAACSLGSPHPHGIGGERASPIPARMWVCFWEQGAEKVALVHLGLVFFPSVFSVLNSLHVAIDSSSIRSCKGPKRITESSSWGLQGGKVLGERSRGSGCGPAGIAGQSFCPASCSRLEAMISAISALWIHKIQLVQLH